MLAVVPLAKASHMAKSRVSVGEDYLGAQIQFPTLNLFFQLALIGWIHWDRNRLVAAPVFSGWPSEPLFMTETPMTPDTSTAVFPNHEDWNAFFCIMDIQYDF